MSLLVLFCAFYPFLVCDAHDALCRVVVCRVVHPGVYFCTRVRFYTGDRRGWERVMDNRYMGRGCGLCEMVDDESDRSTRRGYRP